MKKFLLNLTISLFAIQVSAQIVTEEKIGETYYDLQSNSNAYNTLSRNSDGTISAVWSFSPDSSIGFPNRGTGYNYYDGTSWGSWPSTRIDANRTGFPSIITTRSGQEITIQHNTYELSMNYRAVKGTGAWTTSTPWGTNDNTIWSKSAVSGDSIYVICNGSGGSHIQVAGQIGPIYFTYSFDAGITWSPMSIIPLINSNFYTGWLSDEYSIDAHGSTVAIAYGSTATDVGLLKSIDGGLSWTKTIIQTHPIPYYGQSTLSTDTNADAIDDTLKTSSGDQFVLIDNDGMCHVWFSNLKWYSTDLPGSATYFHDYDMLNYWNESLGIDNYIGIAQAIDYNNDGILNVPTNTYCYALYGYGDYIGSKTGKPTAGIDPNGKIYLTYQSVDETSDTTIWSALHTHVYMMTLPKLGLQYNPYDWTYPVDLIPSTAQGGNGEFREAVYPVIARSVDQFAYVMYQSDLLPGTNLVNCSPLPAHSYNNDIIVAKVDAATLGVQSTGHDLISTVAISPNPASNLISLNFNLRKTNSVYIRLYNQLGEIVYSRILSNALAGTNKIEIQTSAFPTGLYFCSLFSEGERVVQKLVINK